MRGLKGTIDLTLKSASDKFAEYSNCVRVVLLQFFGGELFLADEDVISAIAQTNMPGEIDEVWVANREWTSADDYDIGWIEAFKRVRPVP